MTRRVPPDACWRPILRCLPPPPGWTEGRSSGLLKAYLKTGARVSRNGFIDRDFNSCDVMIVMDLLHMDDRYFRRFME